MPGRSDATCRTRGSRTTSTRRCICIPDGSWGPGRSSRSRRAGRRGWNISTSASRRRMSCSHPAPARDRRMTFKACAWGSTTSLGRPLQFRRLFAVRVRHLGNPHPDHVHPAGLSRVSLAVCRREQLHALGADKSHLDHQRISRPEPVGRGRALLQSRASAGLRPARHHRCGRLPQRRSAEVEFPLSALQHVAPVFPADLRIWRRTGNR